MFWECVAAKSFWFRILRLLARKYRSAIFTWGAIFWGILDQQMVFVSLSSFFLVVTCEKFSCILYFKFLVGNKVLFAGLRLQIVSALAL